MGPIATRPFARTAQACPDCQQWTAELDDLYGRWPLDEAACTALDSQLEEHARWHRLVTRAVDGLPEPEQSQYVNATWDQGDLVSLLREPTRGVTELSKAFFLLHRHRFGRFTLATLADFQAGARLRLYDDQGRALELRGCTAGYGGEGPHGTLWVLRAAGFAEHRLTAHRTDLELIVFGRRDFLLHADGPRGAT